MSSLSWAARTTRTTQSKRSWVLKYMVCLIIELRSSPRFCAVTTWFSLNCTPSSLFNQSHAATVPLSVGNWLKTKPGGGVRVLHSISGRAMAILLSSWGLHGLYAVSARKFRRMRRNPLQCAIFGKLLPALRTATA